jgi:hypothetical protein
MIYCIIAFIGVFAFLMISLVINTRSTRRRIVKSYHMEMEPIKFKPQEINYELNESDVQQ